VSHVAQKVNPFDGSFMQVGDDFIEDIRLENPLVEDAANGEGRGATSVTLT
jgi:hypothetical protein